MMFDQAIPDVLGFLHESALSGEQSSRIFAGSRTFLSPTAYLASALFSASRLNRRRAAGCVILPVLTSGLRLVFSGERLDQDDMDVFLGCVEYSLERRQPGWGGVRFTVDDFLGRLGRRDTPQARERLAASFLRIELSRIALCDQSMSAYTHLLSAVGFDNGGDMWFAEVNPDVLTSFARADNPLGGIHARLRLGARPLAKWLYGLAWSIQGECLFKLEELRELSGCKVPAGAPFAALFRKALSSLAIVGYDKIITEDRGGWIWVKGQKGGPVPGKTI